MKQNNEAKVYVLKRDSYGWRMQINYCLSVAC